MTKNKKKSQIQFSNLKVLIIRNEKMAYNLKCIISKVTNMGSINEKKIYFKIEKQCVKQRGNEKLKEKVLLSR